MAGTFNIGSNVSLIVPVVFTGDNAIGPQITMSLPRVLITPNKAFELISTKLSTFEFDGEVLADVVTGFFGTVSVDGDVASPAVENYYNGTGIVTVDGGDVGDVSKFSFHLAPKLEKHYRSRGGRRTMDFSYVDEITATISMTMGEFTLNNLRLQLMGGEAA